MSDSETTAPPADPPRRIPRMGWAIAFIVFVMAIAYAFVQLRTIREYQQPSDLEKLAAVPAFNLVDQTGQPVSLEALAGEPWVANFIFTTCKGPCPLMTSRMSELAVKLGKAENVRLISFTVDPENDTPEVLAEYGRQVKADPEQWRFVTGDPEQVRDRIVKGFLQPLGESREGEPVHSTRFVVVDAEGNIRSFREGMDPEVIPKLMIDIGGLLREQKTRSTLAPRS